MPPGACTQQANTSSNPATFARHPSPLEVAVAAVTCAHDARTSAETNRKRSPNRHNCYSCGCGTEAGEAARPLNLGPCCNSDASAPHGSQQTADLDATEDLRNGALARAAWRTAWRAPCIRAAWRAPATTSGGWRRRRRTRGGPSFSQALRVHLHERGAEGRRWWRGTPSASSSSALSPPAPKRSAVAKGHRPQTMLPAQRHHRRVDLRVRSTLGAATLRICKRPNAARVRACLRVPLWRESGERIHVYVVHCLVRCMLCCIVLRVASYMFHVGVNCSKGGADLPTENITSFRC